MLNTIFLIAAVVGGTVMVCQLVLSLLGMGEHGAGHGVGHGDFGVDHPGGHFGGHDADADAGADGDMAGDGSHADSNWLFSVITFRTLVAAAAFFGLAGAAALSADMSGPLSLGIAIVAGLVAMYGMYWLMMQISRLASSGNERIANALGRRATVYIPIPAAGSGAGKVQLSMQNRIVEFQAVTEEPEPLKTGETVEVVEVSGTDRVRVRRIVEAVGA
jgi:membrane protein implicated in regulation of membrane protease activity